MSAAKVVLVTGASGHLGSQIARTCAGEGWAVAVHYRSGENQAQQVVEDIAGLGGEAFAVQADLAEDPTAAERIVAEIQARFGRLDALVNNSADQSLGAIGELTDAHWQHMVQVNLIAVTGITRAVVDVMQPGGSVVNVSSVEASSAFPNHAHYAASKAALESFTRSLALELGPRGMRANAIAPGLIERDGLNQDWPEGYGWWSEVAPNRRPVTATQVAAAVAFLISGSASGINGVVLPVDGGWSASARTSF